VRAASYYGTERHENLTVDFKPLDAKKITGKVVILVHDIQDTGITLHTTYKQLLALEPAELRTVVFLRKRDKQFGEYFLEPHYIGYTIPDAFVVGYGLDYHGSYRHHQHISELCEGMEKFPQQHFNDAAWTEFMREYVERL
jgi:hypoxanthine phosphoribosyltransferase